MCQFLFNIFYLFLHVSLYTYVMYMRTLNFISKQKKNPLNHLLPLDIIIVFPSHNSRVSFLLPHQKSTTDKTPNISYVNQLLVRPNHHFHPHKYPSLQLIQGSLDRNHCASTVATSFHRHTHRTVSSHLRQALFIVVVHRHTFIRLGLPLSNTTVVTYACEELQSQPLVNLSFR